jgi:hypothetical protein
MAKLSVVIMMGRGLSDLQKTMIILAKEEEKKWLNAHRNEELKARYLEWDKSLNYSRLERFNEIDKHPEFMVFVLDNWNGRIFFSEIYQKVYGWKPIKTRNPKDMHTYFRPDEFSKKEIGLNKYMSVYMAVRKAAERLEERGLINIEKRGSYYWITQEGMKKAELLA